MSHLTGPCDLVTLLFRNIYGYTHTLTFLLTVSAQLERRGSIFQNGFLGEVLLIFDLPGVVIKTGIY